MPFDVAFWSIGSLALALLAWCVVICGVLLIASGSWRLARGVVRIIHGIAVGIWRTPQEICRDFSAGIAAGCYTRLGVVLALLLILVPPILIDLFH